MRSGEIASVRDIRHGQARAGKEFARCDLRRRGTTISAITAAIVLPFGRGAAPARQARRKPRGKHASQRRVVEQEHAQQHRQQIEEIVVAGERDQEL